MPSLPAQALHSLIPLLAGLGTIVQLLVLAARMNEDADNRSLAFVFSDGQDGLDHGQEVTPAGTEQAVVPNLDKALGQHMKQETTNELLDRDRTGLAVLGLEADFLMGDGDKAGVYARSLSAFPS